MLKGYVRVTDGCAFNDILTQCNLPLWLVCLFTVLQILNVVQCCISLIDADCQNSPLFT